MASAVRATLFAILVAACAKGGGVPGTGDGGGTGTDMIDAPDSPIIDAPPGTTPDAPPMSMIDAAPGTPDAHVVMGTPDAAVPGCTPCTLSPQCGCPAMYACDLDGSMLATGGTTCRNVITMGTETSTCGSVTACAAGYTCLGALGGMACSKFCSTDADCTGPGGLCEITITFGSPPMMVPGVKVCSPNCNPLSASGCPATWGCHVYYNSMDSREFTSCSASGAGGQNAACTDDSSCMAGFSCVNNGTSTVCLKNCQLTPPAGTCPGASSCVGFSHPAVIGTVEYGVCF